MKKNHNQFVRCLENIQDLTAQGQYEYSMIVGGFMNSFKTIKYNSKTKKYNIVNHIDGSRECFKGSEMMNPNKTLIGKAMKKRCLIAIID